MAVLRYEVVEVLKEHDGNTCEVKGKLISVHKAYFRGVEEFTSELNLRVGDEFQQGLKTKVKR